MIGSHLASRLKLETLFVSTISPIKMIGFKDVSMLSWNIWGAANKNAKRHLMELIRKYSPTFLIIMETHTAFHNTKSFWDRAGYVVLSIVEARGQSGGIWFLKQNGSNIGATIHDVFMDTVTIKLTLGNKAWYCTGVYASPVYTTRMDL